MEELSSFGGLGHPGKMCRQSEEIFQHTKKAKKKRKRKSRREHKLQEREGSYVKDKHHFFLEFDYLEADSHLQTEISC